ncbi:hypothetical protein [uncultured Psychroserpens sp.]|uniref:hypothetical protein n=1 Tax=uncultured Psychroserpens sp. TaxID=255436 RepID=UPI00263A344F|nr:hypothetical protein [uncultured Psychroserpens sp.]
MRKLLSILFLGVLFHTCDDGDVFEVELDFPDTFEHCGNLVFFKENISPAETLSIKLDGRDIEDFLAVNADGFYEETINFNNSTNIFNYRTYNSIPEVDIFCNDIPPANLEITGNSFSTTGSLLIQTVLIEDDEDGIPAELEDENLDGDNDPSTNPTDTDQDSIPNYLDADDDGDNVLTINELDTENLDGDNNPLTNPKNTDANSPMNPDNIPDYLDKDDDGDGVDTRDEENITPDDNNPATDSTNGIIADYLNPEVSTTVVETEYRQHIIKQIYTITITVFNLQLPNLTQEVLNFGTLVDSEGDDITVNERVGETVFVD